MHSVSELAATFTGSLNRYSLQMAGEPSGRLDVESFSATEALSQTFRYQVTFTSNTEIAPSAMLLKEATFSFTAPGMRLGDRVLPASEQRAVHGVVTQFRRLSASVDETRYQIVLEPRLALLANASRPAIYQNQSVPEIVEQILRKQHQFEGWQFEFRLRNSYPQREQVMQWQESDLAFIERLLAEVGIWYRFDMNARLKKDVVIFADDQQFYQFDVSLPLRSPSGMNDNGVESVWALNSVHQVVSQAVQVKDYNYRTAGEALLAQSDSDDNSAYGNVYAYTDNFLTKGDGDDTNAEAGMFYARLRQERLLNRQHQLSGESNASTLTPGQMLEIAGNAPDAFHHGVVITAITASARRDKSFTLNFTGIPYSETVGFRPEPRPRPTISGTLPARVTSITQGDTYAHLDKMGRYRVKFDFDLDSWKTGYESLWVRLAKPYSGDTYGMHLPLIDSTEVAIAFEQGNPDRPYIAYALHDSRHGDHITQENNKRNVIRTPANNKLRMDDERGKEHIKLSTEYGGKSQLNLGHLVDSSREARGEGFELRTDQWGAIRAGKGLFVSADEQSLAGGKALDMQAALTELENARQITQGLRHAADAAKAELADLEKQTVLMNDTLKELKQKALLMSAPAGIAQVTPASLQLAAGENLIATSGADGDISIGKKLRLAVGDTLSLFAHRLGIKMLAAKGKVEVQAQSDALDLLAQKQLTVSSQDDSVFITAKTELLLTCGGAFIRIKDGQIEMGAPNNVFMKTPTVQRLGSVSVNASTQLPQGCAPGVISAARSQGSFVTLSE